MMVKNCVHKRSEPEAKNRDTQDEQNARQGEKCAPHLAHPAAAQHLAAQRPARSASPQQPQVGRQPVHRKSTVTVTVSEVATGLPRSSAGS